MENIPTAQPQAQPLTPTPTMNAIPQPVAPITSNLTPKTTPPTQPTTQTQADSSTTPPENSTPNNKKWFFIIVGIVITLLLVAGGIFVYQQYSSSQTISLDDSHMATAIPNSNILNNNSEKQNDTSTEVEFSAENMESWETYSNNKLGFSFKYPKGWQAVQNPDLKILLAIEKQLPESSINEEYCKPGITDGGTDCYPKISLELSAKDKPVDYINIEQSKPCEVFGECVHSETRYITLEKVKVRLEYLQSGSIYPHTSFIDLNSKILRIKGYAPSSKNCIGSSCPKYTDSQEVVRSAEEITEIISTFEFVDDEQATTQSNWKTYTSPEVVEYISPFEISYPSTWTLEHSEKPESLTLTLTNQNKETINIIQGAGGGGSCVYYDDSDYTSYDGMGQFFSSYIQLNKPSNWRISQFRDEGKNSHVVCEKTERRYINTTKIGWININVKSEASLEEVKSILENIVLKSATKTNTLFN